MEVAPHGFVRPHYCACAMSIDVGFDYAALQTFESFEAWRQCLLEELHAVYGWSDADQRVALVSYSTRHAPDHFASNVDEKLFAVLNKYRDAVQRQQTLKTQYEQALEAKAVADAAAVPDKHLSRREREANELARKELRTLKRQLAETEAAQEYHMQQLRNAREMCTIRVYVK